MNIQLVKTDMVNTLLNLSKQTEELSKVITKAEDNLDLNGSEDTYAKLEILGYKFFLIEIKYMLEAETQRLEKKLGAYLP